jgi:hypothetical protein
MKFKTKLASGNGASLATPENTSTQELRANSEF